MSFKKSLACVPLVFLWGPRVCLFEGYSLTPGVNHMDSVQPKGQQARLRGVAESPGQWPREPGSARNFLKPLAPLFYLSIKWGQCPELLLPHRAIEIIKWEDLVKRFLEKSSAPVSLTPRPRKHVYKGRPACGPESRDGEGKMWKETRTNTGRKELLPFPS